MLDTSTNPLIALFFACLSNEPVVGDVIRFTVPKKKVKYFDSDTVSCLANLALMNDGERQAFDTGLERALFNTTIPVIKLLHFIKNEKPYFRDVIDPKDMARILCVRAQHINDRVTAQSGAFLLFGQNVTLPETGNEDIAVHRVRVANGSKGAILKQLNTLAINEGTAFRDIAKYAEYIAKS